MSEWPLNGRRGQLTHCKCFVLQHRDEKGARKLSRNRHRQEEALWKLVSSSIDVACLQASPEEREKLDGRPEPATVRLLKEESSSSGPGRENYPEFVKSRLRSRTRRR